MRSLICVLNGLWSRKFTLTSSGVESFFSAKWFVAAILYVLSVALMAKDPWFGREGFTYAQGGFVILISFVLVTTLSFDWCYLGRSRGGNLVLQLLLTVPMVLLIGRLVGVPSESPWFHSLTVCGIIKSAVGLAAKIVGLPDIIPAPVKEIFASPRAAVFFFAVCVSLTVAQRKMLRVGLVISIFAALIAFALADVQNPPSWKFCIGAIVMVAGIALQFHDTTPEVIDHNLVRRLRSVTDEAERRCTIRILKKACAEGSLSLKTAREVVRRCYVDEFGFTMEQVHSVIIPAIFNRLVTEHQLISLSYSEGEGRLLPAKGLFLEKNDWLAVAVVPRSVAVGIIALLWWMIPIDAVPDIIPVVGWIDDFLIVTLGGGAVWRTLSSLRHTRMHSSD